MATEGSRYGQPARRRCKILLTGSPPDKQRGKCGAQEWLDIMHEAHKLNITTSATMMFGHVETLQERFEHLVKIRRYKAETRKCKRVFAFYSMDLSRM